MGKKINLTLTIDEEILETAKKIIPNLSKLFEDLLKEILDIQNTEQVELIARLKNKEETVKKEKIEIISLRHQIENAKNTITPEEIEKKEKDRIWRNCLMEKRDYDNVSSRTLKNALQLLEKDEKTLQKIINEVNYDHSHTENTGDSNNLLSWEYVTNKYPKPKQNIPKLTDKDIEQMKKDMEKRRKERESKKRYRR